jgi:hypothetical protein
VRAALTVWAPAGALPERAEPWQLPHLLSDAKQIANAFGGTAN